jgi:hypothetical protein
VQALGGRKPAGPPGVISARRGIVSDRRARTTRVSQAAGIISVTYINKPQNIKNKSILCPLTSGRTLGSSVTNSHTSFRSILEHPHMHQARVGRHPVRRYSERPRNNSGRPETEKVPFVVHRLRRVRRISLSNSKQVPPVASTT